MSKITAKECQNVEYKRSWKDEYLKWICGFANAQGATMFFGVDDDLELHGLQNAKKLLEDIPNKIITTMGLVVDVDLHEQDGLDYLEVTIVPSDVPVSYRGKYLLPLGQYPTGIDRNCVDRFLDGNTSFLTPCVFVTITLYPDPAVTPKI